MLYQMVAVYACASATVVAADPSKHADSSWLIPAGRLILADLSGHVMNIARRQHKACIIAHTATNQFVF